MRFVCDTPSQEYFTMLVMRPEAGLGQDTLVALFMADSLHVKNMICVCIHMWINNSVNELYSVISTGTCR